MVIRLARSGDPEPDADVLYEHLWLASHDGRPRAPPDVPGEPFELRRRDELHALLVDDAALDELDVQRLLPFEDACDALQGGSGHGDYDRGEDDRGDANLGGLARGGSDRGLVRDGFVRGGHTRSSHDGGGHYHADGRTQHLHISHHRSSLFPIYLLRHSTYPSLPPTQLLRHPIWLLRNLGSHPQGHPAHVHRW